MPPWGLVRRIDASHFDPGTAYMAVDYHLVDNRDPYLFKTTDFGADVDATSTRAAEGPSARLHAVHCREPAPRGMLFAGTGHGFFYSRDDGKTWTQFKDKLPAAPVNWIEVPKNAAEVAVATYGRGSGSCATCGQLEQEDAARRSRAELQLLQAAAGDAVGRLAATPSSCSPCAAAQRRRSRWRSSTARQPRDHDDAVDGGAGLESRRPGT